MKQRGKCNNTISTRRAWYDRRKPAKRERRGRRKHGEGSEKLKHWLLKTQSSSEDNKPTQKLDKKRKRTETTINHRREGCKG
jgi:hypothetical protein